jgi:glycosyltransferase involved in cell wall biosynthesis
MAERLAIETLLAEMTAGGKSGRHIVVIAAGHVCRNPRVAKEAATLAASGYDVTVLGVKAIRSAERLDAAMLAAGGYRREIAIDLTARTLSSFTQRLRTKLARAGTRCVGRQSSEALGPSQRLLRSARALNPDLVIAHGEAGLWAGWRLIREGFRVAVDFEDWYSEDLPEADRMRRPIRLLKRLEREALRMAKYTTTTSVALSAAMQAEYGGTKSGVITNSFPLGPVSEVNTNPGTRPLSMIWFSQTVGPHRGLEEFFALWSRCRVEARLNLMGTVQDGFEARLRGMLSAEKNAALQFLPSVPPWELPGVLARHDVGLALERPFCPNKDLTITNKILQYLNAGLAVAATETEGQREVLAHSGEAGIFINSGRGGTPAEMERLLSDPVALARAKRAARELAETRYCWERETPHLLELVAGAFSATAPMPPAQNRGATG